MGILDDLLEAAPVAIDTIDRWWAVHRETAARYDAPIDAALAMGARADRLGWAFASGYQAAGASLFGAAAGERPGALCATEEGGAHPRAIATTLRADEAGVLRLDGAKTFVTLGGFAERLYVLASEGEDDAGKKRLRIVAIDASREGVRVEPLGTLPFVPEIPHASVRFERAVVDPDEVLPGPGWDRYVRPFRTVEDCHVHGALLGWLVGVARTANAAPEIVESALALAASVRTIALADPTSRATHRALGGVIRASEALIAESEPMWANVDTSTRERWQRDRALLAVAGRARGQRLEAARAAGA